MSITYMNTPQERSIHVDACSSPLHVMLSLLLKAYIIVMHIVAEVVSTIS